MFFGDFDFVNDSNKKQVLVLYVVMFVVFDRVFGYSRWRDVVFEFFIFIISFQFDLEKKVYKLVYVFIGQSILFI